MTDMRHRHATEALAFVAGKGLMAAALLAMVLIWPSEAAGQSIDSDESFNKGGRTSFQVLKIGLGARQVALGEASIASVTDLNSIFWNPAGLRGVRGVQTSFSYVNWFADMNYTAGAIGVRWRPVGVFAVSIASLDYGDIPEAIVSDDNQGDARTGQTFSGDDLIVGAAYSREFTDRLAIGLGVKFLRENLFTYSEQTFAYDVGTNYDVGFYGTRLAMSAQNFSGSVDWLGDDGDRIEGYDIPLVFRVGISTQVIGSDQAMFSAGSMHDLTFSSEAINTNDFSERVHLGLEYVFADVFSLRGGYRFNYEVGNASFGAGFTQSLSDIRIQIDYAYVSYQYLTAPHRLTMALSFE